MSSNKTLQSYSLSTGTITPIKSRLTRNNANKNVALLNVLCVVSSITYSWAFSAVCWGGGTRGEAASLHRGFHFCLDDHKYLLESQNQRFWEPVFWYFSYLEVGRHCICFNTEQNIKSLFQFRLTIIDICFELYQ